MNKLNRLFNKDEVFTGSITIKRSSINPYFIRGLVNGKQDNNWYRMRGGIMVRQCGKHRRKKFKKCNIFK